MSNDEELLKKIGLNIAIKRKSKSLSQMQLAEICDLNFNYISKIELGKANFSIQFCLRLQRAWILVFLISLNFKFGIKI